MAIRKILTFPDARLRELSVSVRCFDSELNQLAQDMLETMYEAKGIGLAAPQIGELVRLLVVDTRPKDDKGQYITEGMTPLEQAISQPLVILNPEIIEENGQTSFDEGCLSVPSFYETVERAAVIRLRYQDLNGKTLEVDLDGLLAICVQHEIDHLDGKLFIDHLSLLKSNKIKNQIKKHGYPERPTGERKRRSRTSPEEGGPL